MPFDGPAIYWIKNQASSTFLDEPNPDTKVIGGYKGDGMKKSQDVRPLAPIAPTMLMFFIRSGI